MKQFILFYWPNNDQKGGMNDFTDSFDTLEDAKDSKDWQTASLNPFDYTAQILDTTTGEITAA